MSRSAVVDVAFLGLAAGALYLLYQALQGASNAASAVTGVVAAGANAAAGALATAYVWATTPTIAPSGAVLLPNGTLLPTSNAQFEQTLFFNGLTGTATFSYGGLDYEMTGAQDSSGNWIATQVTSEW
jgi:hypothetical protein